MPLARTAACSGRCRAALSRRQRAESGITRDHDVARRVLEAVLPLIHHADAAASLADALRALRERL